MNELTKKEMTEAMVDALEIRSTVDGATHKEDHKFMKESRPFIEAFIKKQKLEQDKWEKVKVHVLGWGIVGIVGGIGTIVLSYFMDKPQS